MRAPSTRQMVNIMQRYAPPPPSTIPEPLDLIEVIVRYQSVKFYPHN